MDRENDTPDGAMSRVDPGRIGLVWGTLFALPAVAFALLLSLDERFPYLQYIAQFATLLAAPLLLILAGIWWATHRRVWHLLLGAAVLGQALLGCLLAALAIWTRSSGDKFPTADVKPLLVAWSILATWALMLALIVSLHVRRALRRAPAQARKLRSGPPSPLGGARFAFRLAMALAVPLLLSAPVPLLLRHDVGLRSNANAILLQEIGKTKAQLGDIADYERIKAQFLARKQIVETLEPYSAQTADVLHVFGRIPDGQQLRSLQTNGKRVSFTIRAGSAADQRALVELLQHSGFRDVDVAPPKGERDLETIAATSTRMDAK